MLAMLCQILQTTDVGAVQAWLTSAHDREKAAVIDMIRTALDTSEDAFDTDAAGYSRLPRAESRDLPYGDWGTLVGLDNGNGTASSSIVVEEGTGDVVVGKVDRLTLEENDERKVDFKTQETTGVREKSSLTNREEVSVTATDGHRADDVEVTRNRPVTTAVGGVGCRQSRHSSEHRADRPLKAPLKPCLKYNCNNYNNYSVKPVCKLTTATSSDRGCPSCPGSGQRSGATTPGHRSD
jgi:hypothetical protein